MRPLKVARRESAQSNTKEEELDKGIQEAFIGKCSCMNILLINLTTMYISDSVGVIFLFGILGYYNLPVSCLVEPCVSRLLRPIDTIFVQSLKAAMKANPSSDVAPIVGMVKLDEGEEFQEAQKESYLYETLGGNNSRAALQVEHCI